MHDEPCIDNDHPYRWLPGEPVLVRYEPPEQGGTILDPKTLEPPALLVDRAGARRSDSRTTETGDDSDWFEHHVYDLIAVHGGARLLEGMAEACRGRAAECRRDCDHAESSWSRAADAAESRSWLLLAAELETVQEIAEQEGV